MNLAPTSRVAIVTGSARGIGRAIAFRLAAHGATVVINGLREAGAVEGTVQELGARGLRALGVVADIRSPQEVNRLVQSALSEFQRVDILVNNAGIARDQLLVRMTEEEWDEVLNTNLRAAFLCARAVLRPMLRQRWGRIINISSVAGLVGNPGQANYAAAKAGLIALTRSLAKEVATRGITVNAVAPGFIETDMTQRLTEGARQEILKQIPVGYFGSVDDVAEAVAFLASEAAHYITGQVLTVDGGLAMV